MAKSIAVLGSVMAFLGAARGEGGLEAGAKAPALKARDHAGAEVDLGTELAKGWVLVYFYPKADTPGCTAQACGLRDAEADLAAKGVRVFGVSGDTAEAQAKFREKHKLPFTLLADTEGRVADAFGVPRMGNIPRRQSFLFRDGVLVWRDLGAKPKTHAADVLAAAGS